MRRTMRISLPALPRSHRLLVFVLLAVALALDVRVDLPGQVVIGIVAWIALFYVLASFEFHERLTLWACLIIATCGELFLSLLWGLYTYRLENVPLFIPPGHVMLLMMAIAMGRGMPSAIANAVLGAAAAYAFFAAILGLDTFAIVLLAFLAAVAFNSPADRPLYASTFLLALALELYGTWLGNWAWAPVVPVFSLVTTNPPGLVSTFYAVLDLLVTCAALSLARRLAPALGSPAAQSL
ncbi:MAG TPA: hypothetical protein VM164_13230 [Burkholderiales bacterium]|nr:hypothetical protein [Burkholderiales bacterium]